MLKRGFLLRRSPAEPPPKPLPSASPSRVSSSPSPAPNPSDVYREVIKSHLNQKKMPYFSKKDESIHDSEQSKQPSLSAAKKHQSHFNQRDKTPLSNQQFQPSYKGYGSSYGSLLQPVNAQPCGSSISASAHRRHSSKPYFPIPHPSENPSLWYNRCYRCAWKGHLAKDCRHRKIRCFSCGRFGHFCSHCPYKKRHVSSLSFASHSRHHQQRPPSPQSFPTQQLFKKQQSGFCQHQSHCYEAKEGVSVNKQSTAHEIVSSTKPNSKKTSKRVHWAPVIAQFLNEGQLKKAAEHGQSAIKQFQDEPKSRSDSRPHHNTPSFEINPSLYSSPFQGFRRSSPAMICPLLPQNFSDEFIVLEFLCRSPSMDHEVQSLSLLEVAY